MTAPASSSSITPSSSSVISSAPYMYNTSYPTATSSSSPTSAHYSTPPYPSYSSSSTDSYSSSNSTSFSSSNTNSSMSRGQNTPDLSISTPQSSFSSLTSAQQSGARASASRWGSTGSSFVVGSTQPLKQNVGLFATSQEVVSFAEVVKGQAARSSRASKWGAPSPTYPATPPPSPSSVTMEQQRAAAIAAAQAISNKSKLPYNSSSFSSPSSAGGFSASPTPSRAIGPSTSRWTPPSTPTSPRPSSSSRSSRSSQSDPNPPSSPRPASSGAGNYPPALIKFVEDSLSQCPRELKDDVEAWLKNRIERALKHGVLESTDWAAEPLAHEAVLDERRSSSGNREEEQVPWWLGGEGGFEQTVQVSKKSSKKKSGQKRKSKTDDKGWDGQPPAGTGPTVRRRKSKVNGEKDTQTEMQVDYAELHRRGSRQDRFRDSLGRQHEAAAHIYRFGKDASNEADEVDWECLKIVGTSQALEKKYLRLTSAPDPSSVRPVPVLEKTLAMLKERWEAERGKCYSYLGEQFKSLRQDLTVQNVRTPFTVEAYETHARVCLEVKDFSEYNQCQTQLKTFYDEGTPEFCRNLAEFLSYRLLYCIMVDKKNVMVKVLRELSAADRAKPSVAHVLEIRACLASNNYHRFFRLYQDTPFMGKCFLDAIVPHLRVRSLATICSAYKPKISVEFLARELGMPDLDECRCMLESVGGVLTADQQALDTKATKHIALPEEKERTGNPDVDVVHGRFGES
eukprot:gb/GEZN01002676.1/.p1 GENE.gb/GEZN01002676.1/~~gb/GEZN01002676.1/.p1  ORF type:complete len:788 (+),score=173.96 gb/GEZN01002676.1/:150-2366(+)